MRCLSWVFVFLVVVVVTVAGAPLFSSPTVYPLPDCRFDHEGAGLATVNGTLYLVGGSESGLVEALQYGSVEELNGVHADLAWRPVSSLRFARSDLSVVRTSTGLVIAIGGSFGGEALAVVEIYRPDIDQWRTASSLPQPRYAASAVVLPNDKVLVTGGFDGAGQPSASVFEYDLASDSWSENTPMPEAKAFHTAVMVDGLILVFCGSNNDAGFAGSVATNGRVEWQQGPAFPYRHYAAAASAVGLVVYTIGGTSFDLPGSNIMALDLDSTFWGILLPQLSEPVSRTSAVSDGSVVFHAGSLVSSHANFFMQTSKN